MNQPVLVGFGDSWAVGHDLNLGEKCYLELTAQKLNIPFLNFAVGSSSIPHMILQVKEFIKTKYFPKNQYHAVFFLTAVERNFFYDQDTKQVIHVSPGSDSRHDYYKIYNNEYGEFVLNTTVLALQRLCNIYDIKDYYMLGWQWANLWPEIDCTKFYQQGQIPITNVFHDQPHIVPLQELIGLTGQPKNKCFGQSHDHPNQLGHEKIAEALFKWIKI
jgi:hypothetical protein